MTFRHILLALACLIGSAVAIAQGPGAGRQVKVKIGPGSATIRFEGLTAQSGNQATGTVWRSTDGGQTWHTDGTWCRNSSNPDNVESKAGGQPVFCYLGLANFQRKEGDILDKLNNGGDVGDWKALASVPGGPIGR